MNGIAGRRWLSVVALGCLMLGLAACAGRPETETAGPAGERAAAASEAEQQVRAVSAAWDSAHNAQDLPLLMALYDSAAVSMPYGRPALEGRPAIQADFQSFFQTFDARHHTTIVDLEVAGDWAIERGRYELTVQPRGGVEPTQETGKHIVIRRRVGDAWKVVWEIWNTDAPAGP